MEAGSCLLGHIHLRLSTFKLLYFLLLFDILLTVTLSQDTVSCTGLFVCKFMLPDISFYVVYYSPQVANSDLVADYASLV